MLVLALEASTGVTSAAVARVENGEREVLAEVWATRGASEALLPAAHGALDLAGATLEGVARILVGIGPGTFTGIRIAASAARSLSLATGIPLATNTSLAALAAPTLTSAEPESGVLAVIDARRRQVFAQLFRDGKAIGEVLCVSPGDLAQELQAATRPRSSFVVGDGATRYRDVLSGLGRIPPDVSPLHRTVAAGHVLGADLSPVPPEEVVPVYVREPDAETRRDLNPWSRA